MIWHYYNLEKDKYSSVGGLVDLISSCPYSNVSQWGAKSRAGWLKVCVQASEVWGQPGPALVRKAQQSTFGKAGCPVSRVPADAVPMLVQWGRNQPTLSRSQGSVSTQNLSPPGN